MSTEKNMEQAIVDAAEKLFLAKGFTATSTTEIAKEAGCNQALVHYYFRKKDKLFEAIFERKVLMFISAILKIEDEDASFKEKLKKRIETHFDLIAQNPKLPLFFFYELNTNPQRLEPIKQKIQKVPLRGLYQMEKELNNEIENGRILPVKIHDLLLNIISLNMILFISEPVFKVITHTTDEEFQVFIKHRRKMNVEMIFRQLGIQD